MRRTNKHSKKNNLDWLDGFFTYINGRKYKSSGKSAKPDSEKLRRLSSYKAETASENDEMKKVESTPEQNRYDFDSSEYKIEELKVSDFENNKDQVDEVSVPVEHEVEEPVLESPIPSVDDVTDKTSKVPAIKGEELPENDVLEKELSEQEEPQNKTAEPEVRVKSDLSAKPLWERNPGKYRKKRPLFIRFLGGLWAFFLFWVLTFGVIGVVALGAGVTLLYSFTDPELDAMLANLEIAATSQILAYNSEGEIEVYEELHSSENRVWLSINEMPQYLLDITVAVEDKRFYQHKGISCSPVFTPLR